MILSSPKETESLGRECSSLIRQGDVIALFGDLGAGKTTFTRGILRGLGLGGEAPSPTFAIVQPYEDLTPPVWHVDLYRIEHPSELAELALDEARADAALIIEWPERLGFGLWTDALLLRFDVRAGGVRSLTAQVPPAWEGRWPHP